MRTIFHAIVFVALFAAVPAAAQSDLVALADEFGENDIEGTGSVALQVTIHEVTAASVGGLEIGFEISYGVVTGFYPVGMSPLLVDDTSINIVVGYTEPVLPDADGVVYLGNLQVNLPEADCCEIFAGPHENASIAGYAAYLDGETGEVIPLGFLVDPEGDDTDVEGWLTIPIATVNCGTVGAEARSWTEVKAAFR
jgi:hypothetical protein